MAKNTLTCNTPGGGNTGTGSCVMNIGRIIGAISIPHGSEIDVSGDLSSIKTSISAAILNNDPLARFYPIPNLVPQSDNTEDLSIQTYPDGTKVVTGEGDYDWTFDLLEGANCLSSRLRKHNYQQEDILLIDENMQLLGQNGSTDAMLAGYNPSIFYALAPLPSQGIDAVTAYRWRLAFRKTQLADNLAWVSFGTDTYLRTIRGLQDVALSQGAARAADVVTIKAKTACGTVDLYTSYSAALAKTTAWKVTRTSNGNVITIDSVVVDANVKGWTITVDDADPDYSATAGQLTISLVGPADLAALSPTVKSYESNTIAQ